MGGICVSSDRMLVEGIESVPAPEKPKRLWSIVLAGVLWSDWGRKERILETLHRIGRQPSFPASILDDGDRHLKLATFFSSKNERLAG